LAQAILAQREVGQAAARPRAAALGWPTRPSARASAMAMLLACVSSNGRKGGGCSGRSLWDWGEGHCGELPTAPLEDWGVLLAKERGLYPSCLAESPPAGVSRWEQPPPTSRVLLSPRECQFPSPSSVEPAFGGGVRRNRTAHFMGLRASAAAPPSPPPLPSSRRASSSNSFPAPAPAVTTAVNTAAVISNAALTCADPTSSGSGGDNDSAGSASEAAWAELATTWEQASVAQTSLLSKLAQHRGLVQFGADFGTRAPPVELRIALPQVEAAIGCLFAQLEQILANLRASSSAGCEDGQGHTNPSRRITSVRMALLLQSASFLDRTWPEYEEQRETLRRLVQDSPLLAPALSEPLSAKLAAAMATPLSSVSTASTPPRSRACSPMQAPHGTPALARWEATCSPPDLALPELDAAAAAAEEEREAEARNGQQPEAAADPSSTDIGLGGGLFPWLFWQLAASTSDDEPAGAEGGATAAAPSAT